MNPGSELRGAAREGRTVEVTRLVRAGVNVEAANDRGVTSLMCAAVKGHTATVGELVRLGANVEAADNVGWTSLMWAAQKGHTATVSEMVRLGANVDAAAIDGRTSLMWAARKGHTATVTTLVQSHCANLEARASDGRTALDFARGNNHTSTVAEIRRLQERARTDLISAVELNDMEEVRRLVAAGARVNTAGDYGLTPLMHASMFGYTDLVTELIENYRANVHAADDEGRTAMMWAARQGYTDTVRRLVERHEANKDAADKLGMTATMRAAERGHTNTVTTLVQLHGANLEARASDGRTALDFAQGNNHTSTVAEIRRLQRVRGIRRTAWRKTAVNEYSEWGLGCTVYMNSITCMPEYVTKSVEELRWEDYMFSGHNATATALGERHGANLAARALEGRDPRPAQPPNQNPSPGPNPNQPSHDFSQLTLTGDRPLGAGSFGEVWRGNWNGTPVAVKFLTGPSMASLSLNDRRNASDTAPELDEFLRESGMMENMRHPNLVQFMGTSTSGIGPRSDPCIVTEFCARGSLLDVLQAANRDRNGETASALTWARRLNMALDAARGMAYLHALRPAILHRDLKSPNMLVTAQWQVKVSDFGLSKISDLVAGQTAMSTVQNINPRWLAPEVMRGDAAGRPADVFSFAVVMWELLTWEFPWAQVVNWPSQYIAILTHNARPPVPRDRSTLPGRREDNAGFTKLEAYIALMERCWSPDPDRRPGFGEIIVQLEDIKTGCLQAPLVAPPSPTTQHAAASSDGRMCVICWANPLEYAFIHAEGNACMIACAACNSRYTDNRCPTCRRAITGRVRVYNAG